MPRNAAVSRTANSIAPRPFALQLALTLTHPESITAWNALVDRCGSAQAAFEALVLLPEAMRGAGFDPDPHLNRCCKTGTHDLSQRRSSAAIEDQATC